MMTEACGATNCTMMEVGEAISSMMKVCGATKSTLSVRKFSGNKCETVYFMMRQKLLHRMKRKCGATSRMMKDELIMGKHQVDGTQLLIYIYT